MTSSLTIKEILKIKKPSLIFKQKNLKLFKELSKITVIPSLG